MARSPRSSDLIVRWLPRARDLKRNDYTSALRLDVVANHSGLSPFHFQRTLASVFGRTPHAYLAEGRLERAKTQRR